jgi:hypothetical protein
LREVPVAGVLPDQALAHLLLSGVDEWTDLRPPPWEGECAGSSAVRLRQGAASTRRGELASIDEPAWLQRLDADHNNLLALALTV